MAEWLWLGGLPPAVCVWGMSPEGCASRGPSAVSLGRHRALSGWEGAVPLAWARRGDSWEHACWGNGGRRVQGPEMLCEELGARAYPAAFPVPLQWFPSATAVTSPQPCSSSSQSGSATQRCHKAQVSSPMSPLPWGQGPQGAVPGQVKAHPQRNLGEP